MIDSSPKQGSRFALTVPVHLPGADDPKAIYRVSQEEKDDSEREK
jgi:hypothetical protein